MAHVVKKIYIWHSKVKKEGASSYVDSVLSYYKRVS
jgi:hypothetical protein